MSEDIEWKDNQGLCWLKGHEVDWDQGHLPCARCGHPLSYEEIGWPGIWEWFKLQIYRIRSWVKCRDCGKWMDRHTSECEQVPF